MNSLMNECLLYNICEHFDESNARCGMAQRGNEHGDLEVLIRTWGSNYDIYARRI